MKNITDTIPEENYKAMASPDKKVNLNGSKRSLFTLQSPDGMIQAIDQHSSRVSADNSKAFTT